MNKVRHICVLALLLVAAGTARAQETWTWPAAEAG